jgi:hypothetical protein
MQVADPSEHHQHLSSPRASRNNAHKRRTLIYRNALALHYSKSQNFDSTQPGNVARDGMTRTAPPPASATRWRPYSWILLYAYPAVTPRFRGHSQSILWQLCARGQSNVLDTALGGILPSWRHSVPVDLMKMGQLLLLLRPVCSLILRM